GRTVFQAGWVSPMAERRRVVIVGGGLSGGSAALTLRELGFDGDIELIGAETEPPYHRPPLSKGYLRGEEPRGDHRVLSPHACQDHRITLRLGARVTAIDPGRKTVELPDGEVTYDHLLVATGGRARTLNVPGGGLPGVFRLRTIEDCDRIRE